MPAVIASALILAASLADLVPYLRLDGNRRLSPHRGNIEGNAGVRQHLWTTAEKNHRSGRLGQGGRRSRYAVGSWAEPPTGYCLQSEELGQVGHWRERTDDQVVDEHDHGERAHRRGEEVALGCGHVFHH